jgi:hypothetical protein
MADQSPSGLTAAEVEAVLGEVLARPEYLPVPPSLLQRWLVAAGTWFRDVIWSRVADAFPALDRSNPVWETLGMVALVVGAMLGLALIIYLVYLALQLYRRRQRRGRTGRDVAGDEARPPTAAEWEALSREAADRGAWREAALALYHGVLQRLADAGMLTIESSKTPGDYRREARRDELPLSAALDTFLLWFERVAYGREMDRAAEFQRLARAAAELRLNE